MSNQQNYWSIRQSIRDKSQIFLKLPKNPEKISRPPWTEFWSTSSKLQHRPWHLTIIGRRIERLTAGVAHHLQQPDIIPIIPVWSRCIIWCFKSSGHKGWPSALHYFIRVVVRELFHLMLRGIQRGRDFSPRWIPWATKTKFRALPDGGRWWLLLSVGHFRGGTATHREWRVKW